MDSAAPRNALFREIHKNTWLKRITSDKKLSVGAKRSEKFWVVFCVHDDFDALLEGYVEPRSAPSHSPEWTISLQHTLHISHALVPLEQEYEFVITLTSDVVRFSASSWEIMQEWVDTLRSKLREMKILSPRENIYSKLPEIRPPLLPTRDPTSPLPAPPPVPAALVPGIERVTPVVSSAATSGQNTPTMSNTLTQNLIAMLSSPIANLRQQSDEPPRVITSSSSSSPSGSLTNGCGSPAKKASVKATQSLAKTFSDNVLADPNTCPPSTSAQDAPAEESANGVNDDRESDCNSVESLAIVAEPISPIVIPRPQTQKRRQSPSATELTSDRGFEASSPSSSTPKTNVTIIQVTNTAKSSDSSSDDSADVSSDHQFKCNVKINPSNDSAAVETPKKIPVTHEKVEISSVHIPSTSTGHYGKICNVSEGQKVTVTTTNSNFATNISVEASPVVGSVYEQVFISTTAAAPVTLATATDTRVVSLLANQARSASHSEIPVNRPKPPEAAGTSGTPTRKEKKSPQKAPSRPILTRGVTEAVLSRPSRMDKSAGNPASIPKTRPQAVGAVASGQDQRKRSSSTSDAQGSGQRAGRSGSGVNSAPGTSNVGRGQASAYRPPPDGSGQQNLGRLTLREQQVMHMRREMMHPGGVRLQLRRKDCLGSIAWVDAFGAVWVSGWKQKEHPMLYNALHVGDQLISVGGVTVGSAADANKLIRSTLGLYVELIIRRVPFGRCYAIRRDLDGQCLGLVRDCATVVDLVPNSLAARHGLPPKVQSCDGLSLTFWVLTEINGRPLNLFAKETEVKDRLNAVGRDISILVQPSDLVAKLKKQLKSLRSHKDYIVQ